MMSGSFSKLSTLSLLRGRDPALSLGAVRVAMPPSSCWESLSSWERRLRRSLSASTMRKMTMRRPAAAPTTTPNNGPDNDRITGDRAEGKPSFFVYPYISVLPRVSRPPFSILSFIRSQFAPYSTNLFIASGMQWNCKGLPKTLTTRLAY
jgi:hypothetical protein